MYEIRGLHSLGADLTALSNQFRQKLFEAQSLIEIERCRKRDSSYSEYQSIKSQKRPKTGPKTITEIWESKSHDLESISDQPWYIAVIHHEILQRLDARLPIDDILLDGEEQLVRHGGDLELLAESVERNWKAGKSTFSYRLNSMT